MSNRKDHVCPAERAGSLDNRFRRLLQNPQKILGNYIQEGMTVLEIGCGPGFFTIDMAEMVGESGRVIASDIQEEMLEKIRDKIRGTEIENRIIIHKNEENRLGVTEKIDFVLLFYMVHEVPNKEQLFREIGRVLKPDGQIFIAEPPFHVSKTDFEKTVKIALDAGFRVIARPKLFLSKTVVLKMN